MRDGVFPGAVLRFIEGEQEEEEVYGFAQIEPTKLAMQEDFLLMSPL